MKDALNKINGGIGGRREGMGSVFAEWVNGPEGEGVGEVVKFWKSEGVKMGWDGGGVLLWSGRRRRMVGVSGGPEEGDVCEVEVELERVGEVLVWLFVGFLTWEEV